MNKKNFNTILQQAARYRFESGRGFELKIAVYQRSVENFSFEQFYFA